MNHLDDFADVVLFVVSSNQLYLIFSRLVEAVFAGDKHIVPLLFAEALFAYIQKLELARVLISNSLNQRNQQIVKTIN